VAKRRLQDTEVRGKRVLVRVDFNVPIEQGREYIASHDHRLRQTLPTIQHLVEEGAKIILCSHLGRPNGKVVDELRLWPVGDRLGVLLGSPVTSIDQCVGDGVSATVNSMALGGVVLLENLRFHSEEEANDPAFAQKLASVADLFVMDAFAVAHRAHASTVGVPQYLPSVAGMLLQREIEYLERALASPEKPVGALLGGAKVSDKITLLDNLVGKVDRVCIGGAMASTFLKAQGYEVGASMVEEDRLEYASSFLQRATSSGMQVLLPTDVTVAESLGDDAEPRTSDAYAVPLGLRVGDIGPDTARAYGAVLGDCKTIIWNGPMGVFERAAFRPGTEAVAQAVAQSEAVSIVGGGSTAEVVESLGLSDQITHVSTGGGAALEYLEGKELPGIAALPEE
jgi:phosphoglycerate kinase